jgi:hypothetical protein
MASERIALYVFSRGESYLGFTTPYLDPRSFAAMRSAGTASTAPVLFRRVAGQLVQ